MLPPPFLDLAVHVSTHNHHDDSHPPCKEPIYQSAQETAPGTPTQHRPPDQTCLEVRRDDLLARLQRLDALGRDDLGGLRLVRLLEELRHVGLDEVLGLEALADDGRREDGVDADAGLLRVRGGVEVHLLRERVGEGAQGGLGRAVRRVAGEGEERCEGRGEDEVARRRGSARPRSGRGGFPGGIAEGWCEPASDDGVGDVEAGEVVGVHLLGELGHRSVDEECGVRRAGTAPDLHLSVMDPYL